MKKLLLVPAIALATTALSYTPSAQADETALRICEYIAANDKSRLRSFLKQRKLKVRSIFDSVQCNGDNMLVFAAKQKALDTGEFLIGKSPAKTVKANFDAIATHSAHLAEEAKERIE